MPAHRHNQTQPNRDQPRKINFNTATREQLMQIPGIGRSSADSIIKYRTATERKGRRSAGPQPSPPPGERMPRKSEEDRLLEKLYI